MNIRSVSLLLLIFLFVLSACIGDAGEEGDSLGEVMDFSEEEAVPMIPEEGMDFSDDEGMSIPAEAEVGVPDEMVFDEDEAIDINQQPEELYPPEGISSWLFEHEAAFITCSGQPSMAASQAESEILTITLGAEGASLVVSDLYGDNSVFYILENAGVGGSNYAGFLQNPSTGVDTHYKIFFYSIIDQQAADNLTGSLRSEFEECVITRKFDGYRQD